MIKKIKNNLFLLATISAYIVLFIVKIGRAHV